MKTFSNFNGTLVVEHGGEKLTLIEVTQAKGTKGKFPGIIASESSTAELNAFIGVEKFDAWIARRWNEETQLIWRDVCEDAGAERSTVLTVEQSKLLRENFSSYLVDSLDGKRSVERDAAWYQGALTKLQKQLAKATESNQPAEINRIKGLISEMKPLWLAARESEAAAIRELEKDLLTMFG